MNILVTGAKGMVGLALCANLKNIRDGKNRTRNIKIDEIFEYDIDNSVEELNEFCQKADFVFNLAGINRPKTNDEFMQGNFGFGEMLLNTLKTYDNKAPVMLSSSIQATLIGRYGQSDYGKSKLAGEELLFRYGEETGAKVAVYRFPNLLGHSRPNYNSAVSTFCNAVANDLPYTVNDRNAEVELLYIDDLVEGMFDLSGLLYAPEIAMVIRPEILQTMLESLTETVVYCVRGPSRSAARGISFCYAVDFDLDEMDSYARNCPFPHYLAFLDAISPWTAPDWVYETCERLPEMSELDAYKIRIERVKREDGTPALSFVGDYGVGAGMVRYRLFKKDEETGQLLSLGIMPTYFDESVGENGEYSAIEPWLWPALEGQTVASYVNSLVEPGSINYLGSIPIRIENKEWFLRYGYFGAEDRYTVYGLWEGYDTDSSQFNRNVKSLSQMVGQEYSVLYPVYIDEYDPWAEFVAAEPQTLYRSMYLEDKPLPPGTYYMQYIVYDMFMRPMPLETIEAEWTGDSMIMPEDYSWEGVEELKIPEEYW